MAVVGRQQRKIMTTGRRRNTLELTIRRPERRASVVSLSEVFDACTQRDLDLTKAVGACDAELDGLEDSIFRDLLRSMMGAFAQHLAMQASLALR
jgi:hypothetical protein